jgi:hypothetical protein
MNCDEAIQILPWLLNGTLEAGERDEVRRHLATCERCRAALNETREAWMAYDQHLPGGALVALAYGEAPPGIDPALAERHLASCPQCAADLELARMSRRLEEDDKVAVFPGARRQTGSDGTRTWRAAALAAGLAGLVAAAGWVHELQRVGDLAAQMARQPAVRENPAPVRSPAPAAGSAAPNSAALDAKMAQLEATQKAADDQLRQATEKVATLDRQATLLSQPQINVWSGPVDPAGQTADVERGAQPDAEAPAPVVVPAHRLALLRLGAKNVNALRDVELLDGRGKVLWSEPGLRSGELQEYNLALPGLLAPGPYTIQLYAQEDGRRVKRESYQIVVR